MEEFEDAACTTRPPSTKEGPPHLLPIDTKHTHAPSTCCHELYKHSISEQTMSARTAYASRDMTKILGNTGNKPKITI